jgi:hypothetical protein
MCAQSIFYLSLSDPNHSCRIPFMPDDIDTAYVTNTFEVKIFERTPVTIVTTLLPSYLHNFLRMPPVWAVASGIHPYRFPQLIGPLC